MASKKPYLAVFLLQIIYAGMILLSKAALNDGMNSSVLICYRQLVGTVVLVPLAFIYERKSAVPLSFVTFCKIFMLSFLGITVALNIYALALVYTSATLGAAIVNSLPVSTFLFAALLRMEKVTVRTKEGIAKIGGLVVCMGGVATLAFYKGPQLKPLHPLLYGNHHYQSHQDHFCSSKKWILGSSLLICSIIFWGIWLVLQARLLKSYPSKLTLTSLQCLSSAIQSFGIAIAFERDFRQWRLGWNMRLLAAIYGGSLGTALSYWLQAWVIEKKGPVFPAIWNPLTLIMTTIGSLSLLGEAVRLGSFLGGILLVLSLYCVLWAKIQEERPTHQASLPPVQAHHKEGVELKQSEPCSSEPALLV